MSSKHKNLTYTTLTTILQFEQYKFCEPSLGLFILKSPNMKFAGIVALVASTYALEDAFLREEDELVMMVTKAGKKAKPTTSHVASSSAATSVSKHHNSTAPINGAQQGSVAAAAGLAAVVAGLL